MPDSLSAAVPLALGRHHHLSLASVLGVAYAFPRESLWPPFTLKTCPTNSTKRSANAPRASAAPSPPRFCNCSNKMFPLRRFYGIAEKLSGSWRSCGHRHLLCLVLFLRPRKCSARIVSGEVVRGGRQRRG